MFKFRVLLFLSALMFSVSASASAPIFNLIDQPVPVNLDGSMPTQEAIKKSIISGCKQKNWTPKIVNDNTIVASILVRSKHFAEVSISFNKESYSIHYKSSKNLKYNEKKQRIHKHYNKWVSMLSHSIQSEFSRFDSSNQ